MPERDGDGQRRIRRSGDLSAITYAPLAILRSPAKTKLSSQTLKTLFENMPQGLYPLLVWLDTNSERVFAAQESPTAGVQTNVRIQLR